MNRALWLTSSMSLLLPTFTVNADASSSMLRHVQSEVSELSRKVQRLGDQADRAEQRLSNQLSGLGKMTEDEGFVIARDPSYTMKVGGYATLTMLYTPEQIGDREAFTTATIPVETWVVDHWEKQIDGQSYTHASKQVYLNAKQSRLNLAAIKQLKNSTFKAYVEGDFWGSGKFRLRYAYGEFYDIAVGSGTGAVTMGQALSAFTVESSQVNTLDFQGPNSNVADRYPLVKWRQQVSDWFAYKVGVEENQYNENADQVKINRYPTGIEVKVQDYESTFPMITGAVIFGNENNDIQLSVAYARLVAKLGSDSGTLYEETLNGYAFNLGGKLSMGSSNNLRYYGVYSDGLGLLIPDLESGYANGVIAFEATDYSKLVSLKSYGVMLGLEHFWTERVSSNLVWGYVNVDNTKGQPSYAYKNSNYGVANLIWTPVKAFMFGIEYQYGTRENKSGKDGHASRVELAAQFNF